MDGKNEFAAIERSADYRKFVKTLVQIWPAVDLMVTGLMGSMTEAVAAGADRNMLAFLTLGSVKEAGIPEGLHPFVMVEAVRRLALIAAEG